MGNVSMEARDINYRGGETKMSVEEALKSTSGEAAAIAALQEAVGNLQTDTGNLQTTKANLITIAPVFSEETAYDPGDLVYNNGLTYRCTNAHEGEWDADDFAATTIDAELKSLNSKFTNYVTKTNFADVFNLSLAASGSGEHALTSLVPFRSYLVMAIGQYNPLWSYIGVLHIVEGGNATLVDLRASANMLTAAITADNKIEFTNENAENAQVINVSIIGYNV